MTPAWCPTLHPTARPSLMVCCFTFAPPARLPGQDDALRQRGRAAWLAGGCGSPPPLREKRLCKPKLPSTRIWGLVRGWEVAAWELGPCQGSGPGLVSARPRLAKSGWVATENKPHPLMPPPASHTKSLIACWCLRISRCPPCCQLSCKMEIASFVTGSMPCNTSGSRVLAVFVLCSQRETICW